MRIQDKVVVITGGASGLGLATAHYLIEEKAARVAIFDHQRRGRAKSRG
ncbi:SDR family NAD(P)-dependent oxidoreductase [Pseudomonas sp. 10S4]|nr:SDR family NAD(P)-dependent oxidoreductase [Pseudomonas sp. 10S4]WPX16557.1 SDR family NAD(P)-dependent oxidoreductase [Pseudomonas sp. 10S4]